MSPPGVQAEEGPEGAAGGPSCLVHQGSHHSGQALHQVPARKRTEAQV